MQTERQKEIIETALDLINSEGIQGLTMKNLSKKIGISEPAIYRHFESKIDILTSVLDTLKNGSQSIFEQRMSRQMDAVEQISILFQSYFKMFANKPAIASVIFSEEIFQHEIILKNKIKEVIDHNNNILVEIIKSGQEKSEIRADIQADDIAVLIMGTLRLFVKKWHLSGFDFNLQEKGKRIISMITILIGEK